MKNFTTTLLFLLISTCIFSQTKHNISFMLDGHMRESIVVIPSHAPPATGYPLVMMLHGTSGDGEKFYKISGWKELGEQENFVTVFPSSLTWCFVDDGIEKFNTRWVNGNVTENPCSGAPQDYVDDVKFLKLLVSMIKDSVPINANKVFISGFSNGCAMIHKIANEAGDVFAAAAGTSALLARSDSSRPVNRIPLWNVVGNQDDRFFFPPYTEVPFGRDSILDYLKPYFVRVLACQGLSDNFTFSQTPLSHTYTFTESRGQEQSKPYIFSLLKGMTHEYPNGVNFPISAPEIFLNFFNQVTSDVNPSGNLPEANWSIYPNPAVNELHIIIPGFDPVKGYSVMIRDMEGRTVLTKTGIRDRGTTLTLDSLIPGVYVVHLISGHYSSARKLIVLKE